MTLINCPECNKEFSDKAPVCPNCRYSLSLEDRIALHCEVDIDDLIEHGRECEKQGHYTEAVKYYTLAAEKGDSTAQNSLGLLYDSGKGAEQDRKKALYWYENALENCGKDAAVYLNAARTCRKLGESAKAIEYYTVAAELGNANTQYELGEFCYDIGDYSRTIYWMDKAIIAGCRQWHNARNIRDSAATQHSQASSAPKTNTCTQTAKDNNSAAPIGPMLGIVVCVCIVIVGLVVSSKSFFGGLLIVAFGGAMGFFAFSTLDNARRNERKESATQYITQKSGTVFHATCAESLPDIGNFSVDATHGKWTYGTSGKIYPVSMITNASMEYETKTKDNMVKRVVIGTVLGGGTGALIGAATSSTHEEKTGRCKLTIETTEPGFGRSRNFTVGIDVGKAIVDAIQQAKER